jgi:outer membrane immunogenic protein
LQQGFTPTGWAAGGGLEYKIAPNWAAKLEYQFIDFGTETANRSWAFPWPARQDFNFSTAKLGLNWYINYPETAPLK